MGYVKVRFKLNEFEQTDDKYECRLVFFLFQFV